jgi:hypothetical protein
MAGAADAASAPADGVSAAAPAYAVQARTVGAGQTRWEAVWPANTGGTGQMSPGAPVKRVWQLPRDAQVPPRAPVLEAQLLAATDRWLLVRDSYPSRLNQGQGACGAGEEVFLRVLRLQPPKQTLQLKLASCWQNLELDPSAPGEGVAWDAARQTLQVRWLSGPAGQGAEQRQWLLQPDGVALPH